MTLQSPLPAIHLNHLDTVSASPVMVGFCAVFGREDGRTQSVQVRTYLYSVLEYSEWSNSFDSIPNSAADLI
jgi:hypothetical protein